MVEFPRDERHESYGQDHGQDESQESETMIEGELAILGARPTQNDAADERRQNPGEEGNARRHAIHHA